MMCFPIPADEPVCVNCNDEGCEYCGPAPTEEGFEYDEECCWADPDGDGEFSF